jgi:hypothetical protein
LSHVQLLGIITFGFHKAMNLIEQLTDLDRRIIDLTKPPITTELRNKLSLAIEQAEAYQAASDKQDNTLAKQVETITKLQEENKKLIEANTEREAERKKRGTEWLNEVAAKQRKLETSKALKYDD